MIGKQVRLLVDGFVGKHRGKVGTIVRYPDGSARHYRNIYMVQVGEDYEGPYGIEQFEIVAS